MICDRRPFRHRGAESVRVSADRARGLSWGAFSLFLLSCGGKPDAHRPLPPATVAACGEENISVRSLEAASAARRASPRETLPSLLADACLAAGARRRALPPEPSIAVSQRAILSRLLLEDLKRAPAVAAAISDADLAEVRAARWFELDHDPAVKVIHAVVTFPETGPRDVESLRKRAEAIRTAVQDAPDETSFRDKAIAAAAGDPQVKVETLVPVLRDGRVLGPTDERYDTAFAAAANELGAPGKQSGLVQSAFGLHVLQVVAVVPAVHLENEYLRALVAREVRAKRARTDLDGLLARLRREQGALLSRDADDLLSRPLRSIGASSP